MLCSDPKYSAYHFYSSSISEDNKAKVEKSQNIIIDDNFSSSYKNVAELKPT